MSTAQIPALDRNKLNAFAGQFVTDLGAAVHTGMVVIGEKLGIYKALCGLWSKNGGLAGMVHPRPLLRTCLNAFEPMGRQMRNAGGKGNIC
jgi:hypothetical protein